MIKDARLSPDGLYRYWLSREYNGNGVHDDRRGTVNFIMLNPSTADANTDDPTIRRCLRYTWDWGFRRMLVTNLFALRTVTPAKLYGNKDPIGSENDATIQNAAAQSMIVVFAWGAHGSLLGRAAHVRNLLTGGAYYRLGVTTKSGEPRHPLYLAANTPLVFA